MTPNKQYGSCAVGIILAEPTTPKAEPKAEPKRAPLLVGMPTVDRATYFATFMPQGGRS
jgi:hypothetical protein